MFLQELPAPEPLQNTDQLVVFVRQWSPATLELGPFAEIYLDGLTIQEFKEKISQISNLPVENIDYAILKGSFPYEIPILSVQSELDWNPNATTLNNWPLNVFDDGHAFLYRDNREQLKELTVAERKELQVRNEGKSLRRYGKTSGTYSPRKERALKIYLDSTPRKSQEDVD